MLIPLECVMIEELTDRSRLPAAQQFCSLFSYQDRPVVSSKDMGRHSPEVLKDKPRPSPELILQQEGNKHCADMAEALLIDCSLEAEVVTMPSCRSTSTNRILCLQHYQASSPAWTLLKTVSNMAFMCSWAQIQSAHSHA